MEANKKIAQISGDLSKDCKILIKETRPLILATDSELLKLARMGLISVKSMHKAGAVDLALIKKVSQVSLENAYRN